MKLPPRPARSEAQMNKLGMFAYLRHMYFGIGLAVYAVIAALLLAVLWKLW